MVSDVRQKSTFKFHHFIFWETQLLFSILWGYCVWFLKSPVHLLEVQRWFFEDQLLMTNFLLLKTNFWRPTAIQCLGCSRAHKIILENQNGGRGQTVPATSSFWCYKFSWPFFTVSRFKCRLPRAYAETGFFTAIISKYECWWFYLCKRWRARLESINFLRRRLRRVAVK